MWGVWMQAATQLRQARRLALGVASAGRPEREAWWRKRAEATWGLDRAFLRGATDGPVQAVPARADRFFAPPVLAGILEADGRQIPALVLGAPAALRGLLEDLAAGRPAEALVVDRAGIGFLVPVVWDPDKDPARARETLRAAALLPPPPPWLWGLFLRLMAQEWLRTPDWGGAAAAGVTIGGDDSVGGGRAAGRLPPSRMPRRAFPRPRGMGLLDLRAGDLHLVDLPPAGFIRPEPGRSGPGRKIPPKGGCYVPRVCLSIFQTPSSG